TPSGSCEIFSRMPPSSETWRGRSVLAVSARKKSMRGSTPFSSLRDCAMGFPTSLVSTCASLSVSATTSSRNVAIASSLRRSGTAAQRGCAARARSYLARTPFASSAASVATGEPSAGLVTLSFFNGRSGDSHHGRRLARLLAQLAGREERMQQRAAVDARRILRVDELGMPLHADHEAVALPADRLHQPVGL